MKNASDQVEVWLDAAFMQEAEKVGILYQRKDKIFFAYEETWLKSDHKFNIDPDLQLYTGEQISIDTYGIFTDSAPDRWGRVLMDKRETVEAKSEQRSSRSLYEWDYLLGVQDETRMGAIRLYKDGVFLDNNTLGTPPITSLNELQEVARHLENDDEESLPNLKVWLTVLLDPGSSLGGARPKANFTNTDGSLWIAKFPKQNDKEDIGLWEAITMELANSCGITVPDFKMEKIGSDHHTFMVKRFDRTANRREMFVSAMTMLQKKDNEVASYMEIAEFLHENSREGDLENQMKELWRRMVFNVMVSNRDDHLRNHGFIRDGLGWYLSPAYDINPNKSKASHSLLLNFESADPTLENLFEGLEYLRINWDEAVDIVKQIHHVLSGWRDVALAKGARNNQIDLISPAFQMIIDPLVIPPKPEPRKRMSKR